jgi:hypothetical protein
MINHKIWSKEEKQENQYGGDLQLTCAFKCLFVVSKDW